MVCNQIERGNPFGSHISDNQIKQPARNSLTTIFPVGIYRTYIWREVFSVMKIIFNHAKAACDTPAIQA